MTTFSLYVEGLDDLHAYLDIEAESLADAQDLILHALACL